MYFSVLSKGVFILIHIFTVVVLVIKTNIHIICTNKILLNNIIGKNSVLYSIPNYTSISEGYFNKFACLVHKIALSYTYLTKLHKYYTRNQLSKLIMIKKNRPLRS